MAISKVILNDETLMDVTQDSVTASTLLSGETATGADGVRLTGTATVPEPSSTTPAMDGTAAVGTATTYARADHVHPTDTSRQATLVSGTNIKTINGTSILGSGDITTPTYTLPTASTSTLGGVKVDGSTITITDGVISSSGGGGGGSTLTLYTDERNYVLYIDAALTDDIASHYEYDYQTMYQVMTDANSIKIINSSIKTTYYPQTVRYVSADDEIRVTAGSVVWNV